MIEREPVGPEPVRVLFCGDREVSARIVEFVRGAGAEIVGLGLNPPPYSEHGEEILERAGVARERAFYGRDFCSAVAVRKFADHRPHLGICCGFTPILPPAVLGLPAWGWVNIHRSYLPYNRGLDPLPWAVVDGTPAGVSLHVMTERVDAGAVIAQGQIPVLATDSGRTLGARADALALDLLRDSWPRLRRGLLDGTPQDEELATYHSRADCERLRKLDLGATVTVRRLLDVLRLYSHDGTSEVYFDQGPWRFFVQTGVVAAAPGQGAAGLQVAGTCADEPNLGAIESPAL